jgi:hypothetical protein
MNNASGASDVALTVWGGAIPEMDPADLPEGGSPQNQDVDYSVGRVFTRGGTLGQFVFAGLYSEKIAGYAQSLPGPSTPNEAPWNSPTNATLGIPGTYANVTLNGTNTTPSLVQYAQGSAAPITVNHETDSPTIQNVTTGAFLEPGLVKGNTLFVFPVITSASQPIGQTIFPISGITDNSGNTYIPMGTPAGFGVAGPAIDWCQPFYCVLNQTVNNLTINYTYIIGQQTYVTAVTSYFSAVGGLGAVDVPFTVAQGTAAGAGAIASPSFTTTNPSDVLVGFSISAAGVGLGPSWTSLVSAVGEYLAVTAVGTYSAAATVGGAGAWFCWGGAFKAQALCSITFTNPVAKGSIVVAELFSQGPGISPVCNDSQGNEYQLAVSNTSNVNGQQAFMFYTVNPVPAGTLTVLITWNGAFTLYGLIHEVAGVTVLDQVSSNAQNSASVAAPTLTIGQNEFSIGAASTQFSATVSGAFAAIQNITGNYSSSFLISAGPTVQATWTQTSGGWVALMATFRSGTASPNRSQILASSNFPFTIPATESVLGLQVEVFGHQSTLSPDAILTAQILLPNGTLSPKTVAFQLTLADTEFVAGVTSFSWAIPLTPALLDNPTLTVNLVATALGGEVASFFIYAVKLKAWLSPAPASNINWLKTYEQTDGEIDTLLLDANGLLWDENVTANPGVLNNISTAIQPGSYAKSVTFDDVEYIGISNLINGTDVPRLWNGQWLDRVSQVGPGAPPSVTTTSSGSAVLTITQNAATALPTGAHDWLLVSAAPSATGTFSAPATPGNVMTIIVHAAFVPPTTGSPLAPVYKVGTNIQILGFPSIAGNNVNNDPAGVFNPAYYTITSVGSTVAGQQSYDWITFQVPFTAYYNALTPGGCTIQSTLATLTAAVQVPFLEVGNQMTVTGAGTAGYDNTFVVAATPNAAQLQITQTSLTANVANYVFTIITGVAPVLGQFATVTGTLNGNGIFNVSNAVITSASPTSFSVSLVSSSNISPAAETGTGIISGTIFQFDPAGTVTNPILGNSTGGLVSTTGVMGVGTRQCVVIFQTRNGALTAPSPFVQFTITASAGAIVVSNIPIGPPNVTARILAFTGANGGNFFWIPEPVQVTTNGQLITYPATLINDNITTQVTLSFPDAVLLAGDAIDVAGNNLFEQAELGSCVGFLSYSDRLIAWQEQNKIQNLLNLSFDGGIGVLSSAVQGTTTTYPLGWTVDPINGGGISLIVSPIFGSAFYIKNATGVSQAIYGMIEQPAYQDIYQVPIVTTNTQYSIRVTACCPSGVTLGNLVMDIYSPKLGTTFGIFSVPLASMTTTMQIFTGTLVTTAFTTVPLDLEFRVYATNLPNGGDVEVDRVEPFPTAEPSFATSFTASYADNPEAFDLVTGHFGPSQNQQPIRGGMVLFDTLYALKTKSWYSTSDTGNSEPAFWNWREVSNKIGTIGSHSYDYGEDWAFSACRAGVYFFSGSEPLKVSQEIAPVWDLINWPAAQSIWLRNDPEQRRLYVGVPIVTPNIYMPQFPINANPQTPNVILMMNYRELNSGMAIADTAPIRSSFSGRLLAPEPARKWSFWNLQSPYADFCDRANNQTPLFLCNGVGNSKVYAFSSTELDDDGFSINSYYITFGLVKADMQDAKGLGLRRMLLGYLSILAEGNGNLNVSVYVQSPQNLPYLLSSIPLSQFTLGDLEAAVNLSGERFFICVGTNAVGSSFSLSKIVASLQKDAWSSVRGTATANA